MPSLPSPIAVQTLNALRDNAQNYESHKRTIAAVNDIISSLGPGEALSASNLTLSGFGVQASVSGVSGSYKRGRFTVTVGSGGVQTNPSVSLAFPTNSFSSAPFAQVVQNGGTGTVQFSYTESASQLKITLSGTPKPSSTYTFQFSIGA